MPPDSEALWTEVQPCVEPTRGLLVIDDTTLDKPYASKMALVTRHWSGKQHEVVQGINLISLVWSDGDAAFPCDFRLYHKVEDGLSKNDHFQAMLETAKARGFQPALVAFDSWYSSLENLKLVRTFGWEWLTRLKSNRQVSLKAGAGQAVSDLTIPTTGLPVHLRGYGMVKVFRTVDPHGNADYWATSRLQMTEAQRKTLADRAWMVEVYHRALKQFTGVERGQFRLESAATQPHRLGIARLHSAGMAALAHPPVDFRRQTRHYSSGGTALLGASQVPASFNCVTSKIYGAPGAHNRMRQKTSWRISKNMNLSYFSL